MNNNKLSGFTQMVLTEGRFISDDVFKELTGQEKNASQWALIMRYYGDVLALQDAYDFEMQLLGNGFAYILVDPKKIGALSDEKNSIFLEIPLLTQYILDENFGTICMTPRVQSATGFDVSGRGILIGVVDSGIDYFHKDFRNADGTTRILSIWDQTETTSEEMMGTIYTQAEINDALRQPTRVEGLTVVPSMDRIGHGTALAGIAAGNGRGSNGKYKGIAPNSQLIVVKVPSMLNASEELISGPNMGQIMLGIDYLVKEAMRLGKPISILVGFGLNEGAHDGGSALEVYMKQIEAAWKVNMVVGVGNQGNKESHNSGRVEQGEAKKIDVFIDAKQLYYFLTTVYGIEDTMGIEIKAPNGESTGILSGNALNEEVQIGGNTVIVNVVGPNAVSNLHQINVLIDHYESAQVAPGTWQIILYGDEIVVGNYNIWGSSVNPLERLTRFLDPDPNRTLTIPSTTSAVTSVGALNGVTQQIANFSGRGYPLNGIVKPDIVAPGVAIIAPTIGLSEDNYASVTGTSASAAFVAGAYALLLEYGIQKKPNAYLYGTALKSFLIKTARRPNQNAPYPNPVWGYGILCVEKALDALKEQYNL